MVSGGGDCGPDSLVSGAARRSRRRWLPGLSCCRPYAEFRMVRPRKRLPFSAMGGGVRVRDRCRRFPPPATPRLGSGGFRTTASFASSGRRPARSAPAGSARCEIASRVTRAGTSSGTCRRGHAHGAVEVPTKGGCRADPAAGGDLPDLVAAARPDHRSTRRCAAAPNSCSQGVDSPRNACWSGEARAVVCSRSGGVGCLPRLPIRG